MAIISLVLILVLTAADQLIKYFVVSDLQPLGSITLIPGFLEFRYIENSGAAFGMLQNMSWLFSIITIIISICIIVFIFKYQHHNLLSYAASVMVVAGGFGNLLDRILRQFVVDFIHFEFFPYIFNFADCLVTVGVVLFIIHMLLNPDKKKNNE